MVDENGETYDLIFHNNEILMEENEIGTETGLHTEGYVSSDLAATEQTATSDVNNAAVTPQSSIGNNPKGGLGGSGNFKSATGGNNADGDNSNRQGTDGNNSNNASNTNGGNGSSTSATSSNGGEGGKGNNKKDRRNRKGAGNGEDFDRTMREVIGNNQIVTTKFLVKHANTPLVSLNEVVMHKFEDAFEDTVKERIKLPLDFKKI